MSLVPLCSISRSCYRTCAPLYCAIAQRVPPPHFLHSSCYPAAIALLSFSGSFGTQRKQESNTQGDGAELGAHAPIAMCSLCRCSPCLWLEKGKEVIGQGEDLMKQAAKAGHSVENKFIRFQLYSWFVFMTAGPQGKGNRLFIPHCVRDGIRAHWPEKNSAEYTGHRQSDDN